jgi:hypothetical protein
VVPSAKEEAEKISHPEEKKIRVSGQSGVGNSDDEESGCDNFQQDMKLSGHKKSRQAHGRQQSMKITQELKRESSQKKEKEMVQRPSARGRKKGWEGDDYSSQRRSLTPHPYLSSARPPSLLQASAFQGLSPAPLPGTLSPSLI